MNAWQKTGYVLGRITAPILIVALGVGGLLVFGQKPPTQEKPAAAPRRTLVETVAVRAFDGSFRIEVEGVAIPLRQIQTSSQVAGIVTMKSADCRGGRYVSAGQSLIKIDSTDYVLEQDRLQAQWEQATETLAEVDVQIENTTALLGLAEEDVALQQRNLERVKVLFGRSASTDAGLDDAREQELASRNARQMLRNQLKADQQRKKSQQAAQKLVQAQLKRAETDLARTSVQAPVSGTIVTTDVEEGDYVKVGDPLFRTNDTDDMEVSCQLRVDELYWIWLQAGTFGSSSSTSADATFEIPQTPVEIAFEFQGVEYLWRGELSRYAGNGLDPATRTVPCRVLVKDPTDVRIGGDGERGIIAPPTLFSGMYLKVRIPIESPVPLVEVPATAVQPSGEVWLVRDGALDIEPVAVARIHGGSVLLRPSANGPQPGEQVVVSPLAGPVQGLQVEAVRPDSPRERAAAEDTNRPSPRTGSVPQPAAPQPEGGSR